MNRIPNQLLTLQQAKKMLGVSRSTLHKWDADGTLKAIRINTKGHRRWDSDKVFDFIEGRKQV